MNEPDQLIEAQFNRLPEKVRKALNIVPWKSFVKEIALLNKLSSEQIAAVERETMFILYGFENPDDYVSNLMREAQISEEVASAIALAADDKVLKAIAEEVDRPISVSNTIHNNLPMVEPGEVAHTVDSKQYIVNSEKKEEPKPQGATPTPPPPPAPQTTAGPVKTRPHSDTRPEKPASPTPDYRYPGGADPYREPIQ